MVISLTTGTAASKFSLPNCSAVTLVDPAAPGLIWLSETRATSGLELA